MSNKSVNGTTEQDNYSSIRSYYAERGYTIITSDNEDLNKEYPELRSWLKSLVRYGNVDSCVLILKKLPDLVTKVNPKHYRVKFFTESYEYTIVISGKYMGAFSSCRKSLPGETWTRGSDLKDGEYSYDTWNKIVYDILRNELKTIKLK